MAYYRKSYFCVCEGQQEKMYLENLAKLINDFPTRVVKFNIEINSPIRLKKTYAEYDSVAIFDHDLDDEKFMENIVMCDRLKNQYAKKTRGKGKKIYHAYSNLNFDLWLILHKGQFNRFVTSNKAYVEDVRRIYKLGSEDNIKQKSVMEKILLQITLEDVKRAINRAKMVRSNKLAADKVKCGSSVCYPNPDFSIHEFLSIVLADCGLA